MKKLLFIFACIITSYTHAMELEVAPCFFTNMPEDVQDLIASFLTFDDIESEEEFIQRTQSLAIETTPEIYLQYMPAHNPPKKIWTEYYFISARSSDNRTIGIVQAHELLWSSAILVMIDTQKKSEIYQEKLYLEQTAQCCYAIAVSRDQHMFACINGGPTKKSQCETSLTVKNIISQKTKTYIIPQFSAANYTQQQAIAFNKQGTHIILHGTRDTITFDDQYGDYITYSIKPVYHIIPLTINTPNPDINNKKTLQHYFAQKMICKAMQ